MLKVLVAFVRILLVLANGAVTFITPNCRRTIPGGIAARGVTAPPPAGVLAPGGAAVLVGMVCKVLPDSAGVVVLPLGIRGVEVRVLGTRGVEVGVVWIGDEEIGDEDAGRLLLGLDPVLLSPAFVEMDVVAPLPHPLSQVLELEVEMGLALALGQLDTVIVVVVPGHAAQSALARGQIPEVDEGVTTDAMVGDVDAEGA
ncbi:hypothetical protein N7488_001975 [Penicillium malachiteum]|nr:hypothetical protein N7488_001975 [Penicillium malachiteum]